MLTPLQSHASRGSSPGIAGHRGRSHVRHRVRRITNQQQTYACCPPVRYEARVLGGILGGEEMTMTKLAILILVMAALLFMFIPNLSPF